MIHIWDRFKRNKLVCLLLLIWVVKNSAIALLLSPWQAEDEFDHFGYVTILDRTGGWFATADESYGTEEAVKAREMLEEGTAWFEVKNVVASEEFRKMRREKTEYWVTTTYQPVGYYALLRLPYQMFSYLDIYSLVYVLRLTSVLISVGSLIFIWQAFKVMRISENIILVAMTFFIFNPQFSLLNSVINPEVLLIFWFALLQYLLALGLCKGWSWKLIVGIGMVITLGFLTKQTMVLGALMTGVIMLYQLWSGKVGTRLVLLGVVLAITGALIVVPIHRRISSQTQFFGENAVQRDLGVVEYANGQFERLKNVGYESFWQMNYAMLSYEAPEIFVRTTRLWLLVSGGSWVWWLIQKRNYRNFLENPKVLLLGSGLISTLALMGLLIYWDFQRLDFNTQYWFKGRYLFPMILPIGWAVSQGLWWLPVHMKKPVMLAWVGFWVSFQIWCVMTLVANYSRL